MVVLVAILLVVLWVISGCFCETGECFHITPSCAECCFCSMLVSCFSLSAHVLVFVSPFFLCLRERKALHHKGLFITVLSLVLKHKTLLWDGLLAHLQQHKWEVWCVKPPWHDKFHWTTLVHILFRKFVWFCWSALYPLPEKVEF